MNRPETNHCTGMWFTVSLAVWVLFGGIAFSQTPVEDTQEPPPNRNDTDHGRPTDKS